MLGDITNNSHVNTDDTLVQKPPALRSASALGAPSRGSTAERSSSLPPQPPPLAENVSDRSYMQREVDDIDSRDHGNPLLVTAYVNEIYDHYCSLERANHVNPAYMAGQEFINEKMRTILVDWLVEVHLKFKMVPESLYITIQVIDRYLSLKTVRRSKLQLVGVASLLVAAKYEEIYPPELKELVYITDNAYSKQEILEMEAEILTTLDYRFTLPTIHSFLCRFLKAAHADRSMVQLSCYLTERCLQEYSMLRFFPSQIAATAVMVARTTLRRHPWSPTLLKYSGYDEADLSSCAQELKQAISNPSNQQQAVHRKYSSTKFGGVAKLNLAFP